MNVPTTKLHTNYQWQSNLLTGVNQIQHSKLKWKTTVLSDPTLIMSSKQVSVLEWGSVCVYVCASFSLSSQMCDWLGVTLSCSSVPFILWAVSFSFPSACFYNFTKKRNLLAYVARLLAHEHGGRRSICKIKSDWATHTMPPVTASLSGRPPAHRQHSE